ncbi:serpin family protein [Halorussus gelatinilyticus]|uniref:Serpin family protein n=1 Tax=Halorussus gelatinilyticus TaxID=2937524 RepID=A0A8U0IIM0_9EURY|nr:serpin family protein [Halorussus gelatinilyticus]UPW00638.1 serpin family protein [Halorussus gelatinilyticus]
MTLRRRETLALSGAFLAGLAGCTGSDDPQTTGTATDTTRDTSTSAEPATETTTESPGFDDLDAPSFPQIDPATDPEIAEDLLADQIRGNVAFALDLLEVLRDQRDAPNCCYSPYSVSVALAMTYAGARGETAAQLADALHFVLDREDLHPAFASLAAEFERRNADGTEANVRTVSGDDGEDPGPAFELTTANAVWGQEGYPFREEFLDLLDAYYGAGLRLADFRGSPETARKRINSWVADNTGNRIEDLLVRGSIDQTTRLVLTNAVYFSARWKVPFSEEETEPREFTALDGTTTEVPTMHQSIEVQYAEIEGHQLVELPYANEATSMVVVLPAAGEFEDFEASLTVDRLATMLDRTTEALVDLALPKFKVDSSVGLVEALKSLGVERAFGPSADLSGMSAEEDSGLSVSDVRHRSVVSVDERGTEAAAATAAIIAEDAPPRQVEMRVNRPFLFYVRDRPTETPLFVGRVTDLSGA